MSDINDIEIYDNVDNFRNIKDLQSQLYYYRTISEAYREEINALKSEVMSLGKQLQTYKLKAIQDKQNLLDAMELEQSCNREIW